MARGERTRNVRNSGEEQLNAVHERDLKRSISMVGEAKARAKAAAAYAERASQSSKRASRTAALLRSGLGQFK